MAMNMISNGAIGNEFIHKKKFTVANPNCDVNVNFPLLQPPIGEKRVEEFGKWVRKEFCVCGCCCFRSRLVCCRRGSLGVWTYKGVDVVLCNSLIPYRSHTFEVAEFAISKIVPKADQALNCWVHCTMIPAHVIDMLI